MAQNLRDQYKLRVEQDVAETMASSGGILNKPNAVSSYQKMYQRAKLPVHLLKKGDGRLTQTLLMMSYGGIAVAVGTVLMMASGSLKKS